MASASLTPTLCAICGSASRAAQIYAANFDVEAFNPAVFSARRTPDRIHCRIVKCEECGLVRSDPAADPELLAHLYTRSNFDYGAEVANIRATYGRALGELDRWGVCKDALLEVGCGNGFFLREARARGYAIVRGVEPSADAVSQADADLRPLIIRDILRPGLFPAASFDVICLFQVLDHLPDPVAALRECQQALRPGGLLLCLNHDVESLSARVLRERSPIIDIEHTFLFSRTTISRVLAQTGFAVLAVGSVRNTYSVHYLARLLPLPSALKSPLLAATRRAWLKHLRLTAPLGNLRVIARKAPVDSRSRRGSA